MKTVCSFFWPTRYMEKSDIGNQHGSWMGLGLTGSVPSHLYLISSRPIVHFFRQIKIVVVDVIAACDDSLQLTTGSGAQRMTMAVQSCCGQQDNAKTRTIRTPSTCGKCDQHQPTAAPLTPAATCSTQTTTCAIRTS